MTDSLDNTSLTNRTLDINTFIEALNEENFRTFKILESINLELGRLQKVAQILNKKEYAYHDRGNIAKQKELIVIDWDIAELPKRVLENSDAIMKKLKKQIKEDPKNPFFTDKFPEIASSIYNLLNQLLDFEKNKTKISMMTDTIPNDPSSVTYDAPVEIYWSDRSKMQPVLQYFSPPKR